MEARVWNFSGQKCSELTHSLSVHTSGHLRVKLSLHRTVLRGRRSDLHHHFFQEEAKTKALTNLPRFTQLLSERAGLKPRLPVLKPQLGLTMSLF